VQRISLIGSSGSGKTTVVEVGEAPAFGGGDIRRQDITGGFGPDPRYIDVATASLRGVERCRSKP